MNSRRYADNIPGPNSSRQGRAQSLKAVNIAVTLILSREDKFQGLRQFKELNQL